MKLSDVRPGMTCEGRSVIRGTAIARFRVQVLDVVTGDPSDAGPRILIRASGPAVDETGLGFGFSGSPIYCRDASGTLRNIGAFSEGLGEYGNEVGLATPIEEILSVTPSTPRSARHDPRLLRSARPLDALTVVGLPARMRRAARRGARRAGRQLLAVPGRPAGSFPPQQLVPGASVATTTSDGDLSLGAIGTVAYRDGPRVWAFGHELDGAGRRSLFLQDAYVFTVISNPNVSEEESSYKLAAPGHTLGSVTEDTFSAVAGTLGPQPRPIGLRVTARNRDTGRRFVSNSRVADEERIDGLEGGVGFTGELALGQAADGVLRSAPPRVSGSMCARFRIAQRKRPLGFCGTYFDGASPIDDFDTAAGMIEGYELGRIDIESASLRLRLGRGARESTMLRGRPLGRARRGRLLRVRLALRRRRGGRERITVAVRVPRHIRAGRRTLTLKGTVPRTFEDGIELNIEAALRAAARKSGRGSARSARKKAKKHKRSENSAPTTLGELADDVGALGGTHGITASFGGGTGERRVFNDPRRLVRGKIRVPVRVVGRRHRRR